MTDTHPRAHQRPPAPPEPTYVDPALLGSHVDPCPFCSSTQIGVVKRSSWTTMPEHYYCKCATCGATGPNAVQRAHLYEQYSEGDLVQQAKLLWAIRPALPDKPEAKATNPWQGLVP